MDVTKVDSNQLAGLQAACDAFNTGASASFIPPEDNPDATYVTLSLQEYWDKCWADAKNMTTETEEQLFARATESYQYQYDVGLGKSGVEALSIARVKASNSTSDEANAILKAAYEAEQARAASESAALIAAGK